MLIAIKETRTVESKDAKRKWNLSIETIAEANYWILPASFCNLVDFQAACCSFWLLAVSVASAYSVTFLVALRTRLWVDKGSASADNPWVLLMAESWIPS